MDTQSHVFCNPDTMHRLLTALLKGHPSDLHREMVHVYQDEGEWWLKKYLRVMARPDFLLRAFFLMEEHPEAFPRMGDFGRAESSAFMEWSAEVTEKLQVLLRTLSEVQETRARR